MKKNMKRVWDWAIPMPKLKASQADDYHGAKVAGDWMRGKDSLWWDQRGRKVVDLSKCFKKITGDWRGESVEPQIQIKMLFQLFDLEV